MLRMQENVKKLLAKLEAYFLAPGAPALGPSLGERLPKAEASEGGRWRGALC